MQRAVAILPLSEERSSQLLRGGHSHKKMVEHVNATRTTKLQDDKKFACFEINTQRLCNFYCTEPLKIQQNNM